MCTKDDGNAATVVEATYNKEIKKPEQNKKSGAKNKKSRGFSVKIISPDTVRKRNLKALEKEQKA
jgi:hypothetical protein